MSQSFKKRKKYLTNYSYTAILGSTKSYLTGFILSLILTIIPFWIVISNTVSRQITIIVVSFMAIIQIFVHLVYFLHINNSAKEYLNLIALVFTALIITIIIIGSLWIMYHLNINMVAC
ncbi:cytochrome o ubiquinol oxidase subunit IV [Candidatus Profftia sp. (ex Adelges kitamiensis)]|uniref:cytochrome o ubiquinol oxidase subunit IV n=1 Tax=Candidatus Profftia sp. (ex Adelges kitamiensis) TaxID=2864218 RepID=UPI001CE25F55|nr:cytochrome o ubiquinol oxidase subunit IV [Candidatus Profftia sp. (ex Adelges kitamiensis)]